MAKLTKSQIEKLSALGITEKDEAAAKKAVLKHLADNDIMDVDDELLDDLIEMGEAFPITEEAEEDDEATDDEELDAASDELEDEEEEAPAPKRAPAKKAADAPAEKAAAKKAPAKKAPAKKSKKIDPANIEEDRAHYDFLSEKMPNGDKYEYCWLSGGGLAIKHIGKNAKKSLISFEPSLQDGTLVGNLIFNIWKKNQKRLKEILGSDFDLAQTWSGNPYIAGVSSKDYLKILSKKDFMKEMLAMVEKSDTTLGKNRDKMEENLKNGSSKTAPKAPAKPAAKAPAPAKKAAAPAKKAAPAPKATAKKAPAKKAPAKK